MIQQAAYESLLEERRTVLHLRVAEAVQRELPSSTPGYFGMLAYHFGMGRNLERAEEFLFKAGDEAARVAANAEALSFFQEASRLFVQQHGDAADPRKLAERAKRLAGAFLHRGTWWTRTALQPRDRAARQAGAAPSRRDAASAPPRPW
jgi:hypothetical protein